MRTAAPATVRTAIRYREAVAAFADAVGPGWAAARTPTGRWAWTTFRRPGRTLPAQGWKLHVSASAHDAPALVDRVLPELARFDVAFKLPDTFAGVVEINAGRAGATQIGKIVTVYPASDAVLRDVVDRLAEVWRPDASPPVPSDLRVGDALWIRFGPFERAPTVADALGRLTSGLVAPDGTVRPDLRAPGGAPGWAPPPPLPVANARPPEATGPLLVAGERYVPLRYLARRVDGTVLVALRVSDVRLAVVRRAVPGVRCDEHGNDAVTRLENEHRALRVLDGVAGCPELLGHDGPEHVLVTGDVGGRTLESVPADDGLAALAPLADVLAAVHRTGLVHRDVTPSNVLVDGAAVHLIDYELAAARGTATPVEGGTRGYCPPGAERGPADPAHDVHALGSCLTYVALRTCPGRLPAGPGRRVGLLHRTGRHTAARLVQTLSGDGRPTAGDAAALLRDALPGLRAESDAAWSRSGPQERWCRRAVVEAGRAAGSFRVPLGHGRDRWRSTHLFTGHAAQALNIGAAGIALALTTIDEALGRADHTDAVLGAAGWLAAEAPYAQAHGLFTGNAGVAVALAVAGRRHDRPDLVDAARARLVAAAAHDAPDFDLFSGAAGIVRAGCLVAAALDEQWPLDVVSGQPDRIRRGTRAARGGPVWRASPDFDASGAIYHGAAHGAAGVGLALAGWGRATGAPEPTALAAEVFRGLHDTARTSDGDNIVPSDGDLPPFGPLAWCHGIAGVLWCLEQAFGGTDTLRDVRDDVVDAVLRVPPPIHDPTLCHGTAGALDVFRTAAARAGTAGAARARAGEAVAVLRSVAQRVGVGTVWGSEEPSTVTPDLWVGFLGPATSLALHAAGVPDPLLSPAWLSRCARPDVSRPEG